MQRVLIIIALAMVPTGSTQNATDRDAVLKVVQIFFDTMTARDVEGARRIMVFAEIKIHEPRTDLESGSARAWTDRVRVGAL